MPVLEAKAETTVSLSDRGALGSGTCVAVPRLGIVSGPKSTRKFFNSDGGKKKKRYKGGDQKNSNIHPQGKKFRGVRNMKEKILQKKKQNNTRRKKKETKKGSGNEKEGVGKKERGRRKGALKRNRDVPRRVGAGKIEKNLHEDRKTYWGDGVGKACGG